MRESHCWEREGRQRGGETGGIKGNNEIVGAG